MADDKPDDASPASVNNPLDDLASEDTSEGDVISTPSTKQLITPDGGAAGASAPKIKMAKVTIIDPRGLRIQIQVDCVALTSRHLYVVERIQLSRCLCN